MPEKLMHPSFTATGDKKFQIIQKKLFFFCVCMHNHVCAHRHPNEQISFYACLSLCEITQPTPDCRILREIFHNVDKA